MILKLDLESKSFSAGANKIVVENLGFFLQSKNVITEWVLIQ